MSEYFILALLCELWTLQISKQILQIEQKLVKNPNWCEANQLAIYKA